MSDSNNFGQDQLLNEDIDFDIFGTDEQFGYPNRYGHSYDWPGSPSWPTTNSGQTQPHDSGGWSGSFTEGSAGQLSTPMAFSTAGWPGPSPYIGSPTPMTEARRFQNPQPEPERSTNHYTGHFTQAQQQIASMQVAVGTSQGPSYGPMTPRFLGNSRLVEVPPSREYRPRRPSQIRREDESCTCWDENCTYVLPNGGGRRTTFTRQADLERHIQTMHNASAETFRCPGTGCTYYSKRRDKMHEHYQKKHGSDGNTHRSSRHSSGSTVQRMRMA